MSEDCFAVFMDESGLGSKRKGKANYWVSVGVMAGINDHYSITQDIHDLKKKSMRLYNKEMKGTDLSANHLNAGITKETVAKDLAEIIKKPWIEDSRNCNQYVSQIRIPNHIYALE